MIVLVTGGSGFLGSRFVTAAVAAGHDVRCVVRSEEAAARVRATGGSPLPGDLDDPESLDRAFGASSAEVLVNIASLGFGHADSIVAAAEGAGMTRAVFVSTTAVTTTLPASSKRVRLAAERVVQESGLDWTIVRPTMIYGAPGDRNIARLLKLLRRAPVLPVPGGGQRLQQPVHVDDAADALLAAMTRPIAIGKTYDVAGPRAITFRQLLEQSGASVGRRVRLVPVPLEPCIRALRLYERLAPRPRLKAEQLERLAEDKAFDIGPAVEDLGYTPREFVEGVRAEAAELSG